MTTVARHIIRNLALGFAVLAILAGCAQVRDDVRQIREALRKLRGKEPAPQPPAPPPVAQTPAPATPGATLKASCVDKDETGYAENAHFEIAAGQVRSLDATITIPNRGSCRYQLSAFRQTKSSPFVELQSASSASCVVRIWQQGDRVTMAPTDCADKCTRGAFDYAWPIEFKTTGGCA